MWTRRTGWVKGQDVVQITWAEWSAPMSREAAAVVSPELLELALKQVEDQEGKDQVPFSAIVFELRRCDLAGRFLPYGKPARLADR